MHLDFRSGSFATIASVGMSALPPDADIRADMGDGS